MLSKLKQGHWPLFILNSFSSFANLFLPVMFVRLMTPSDMGIYKIYFLYFSILPFLFLTAGPSNSVYYWVGKSKEHRAEYIQSCWILTTFLSSFILLIGLPLSGFFSDYLNIPMEYVIYMIVAAFFWEPSSHYGECLVAHGKTLKGSLYGTSFTIIKVVLFIGSALYIKDLKYIFIIHASIFMINFFTTIYFGKKNNYISFNINYQKLKEIFLYSLPISVSGLLGFFVDKVDMIILSGHLSTDAFAFYSMGCLIIPPLYILDTSVQKILIPKLSSLYIEKKFSLAVQHYNKAISDLSFLIIPAICGLFVFAEPIINLLYTDQYSSSIVFFKIFAFSYLLNLLPHDAVPRATGHSGWILKIYLIITPISLAAVYISAKYFGAETALIVAIIIKFIPKIVGIIYSANIMDWKIKDMFPIKKLLIFSSLALTLSFISIFFKDFFLDTQYWLYICAPLFAVVYLGTLYKPLRKNA